MDKKSMLIGVLSLALLGGCGSDSNNFKEPSNQNLEEYSNGVISFDYDKDYWGTEEEYTKEGREGVLLQNDLGSGVSVEYSGTTLSDTQLKESLSQYKILLSNGDVRNEKHSKGKVGSLDSDVYAWNDSDNMYYEVVYLRSDDCTVIVNMSLSDKEEIPDMSALVDSIEVKKTIEVSSDGYDYLSDAKLLYTGGSKVIKVVKSEDGVYDGYSVSGSSNGVTCSAMVYENSEDSEDYSESKLSEVMDTEKGMLEGLTSYSNLSLSKVEKSNIYTDGTLSYEYSIGESSSNGYIKYFMCTLDKNKYMLLKVEVNNLEWTDKTEEILREIEDYYGVVILDN